VTTTNSPTPSKPGPVSHSKRPRARSSLFARGEPMLWMTGGALVLCIAMIAGLLLLVAVRGSATFFTKPVVRVQTLDGRVLMGEPSKQEEYAPTPAQIAEAVSEKRRETATMFLRERDGTSVRRMLRTGNFELTQTHFHWVSDFELAEESTPEWATVLERFDWGRFYGFPKTFVLDGKDVADSPETVWELFEEHHGAVRDRRDDWQDLKDGALADLDNERRDNQKDLKLVEIESGVGSAAYASATKVYEAQIADIEKRRKPVQERVDALARENEKYVLVMATADGAEARILLADIVRGYQANTIGFFGSLGVYVSRWWEFLTADPREANAEGGVFPAIFGTVIMTLLMVVLVVPFGVLAALYLREYARQGVLVSIVRIAVNNLAGVPSIVYGVFGLGFFCYIIGARIDEFFFAADLADGNPTFGKGGLLWASLTLALLTLPVVIVATEEALAAVPRSMREGSYACGASKWQTIRRIVLPRAMPGIMTGAILALARGAGEVAPLMLVGAAKIAPELPIDGHFPYLHAQRSFMHLGFHIYDVGFQSQNSEAARPLVFTTTLLLIAIIVLLNAVAIWARGRLRKKLHA